MVCGHIYVGNFLHCPSYEAKHGPEFKTVYFKQIHRDMFSSFSTSYVKKGTSSLYLGGRLGKWSVSII